MKPPYVHTVRVGVVRACLRFIEDPTRSTVQRIVLALAPLLILYVVSPLDIMPEFILGPLGLADDTAILISLFLLIRLATSFYREKRYVAPTRKQVTSTVNEPPTDEQ